MRHIVVAFAVAVASLAATGVAGASVVVTIDKSQQLMSVAVDGVTRYNWPVSTARAGYTTPNGTYRPQVLARSWFSRKYYNSPMPHSIFFHGGYAIHGSYEISRLGGPASHGCVRLHPSNAATLFALVKSQQGSTRIVVTGSGASARIARPPQQELNYAPAPQPGAYSPYGTYPAAPAPGVWWPSR
jgi:lipoprotein-anchoring transpeptidase ErfK/SrfK